MRMMTCLAVMTIAAPVAAHDFWLQPQRFSAAVGAPLPMTLLVGHGTARQRWGVKPTRVLKFNDVTATGTRSHLAQVHTDSGDEDAVLRFAAPGVHMLVVETNHATSILPAIRFNDYAKVEGLTPILAARTRAGTTGTEGREIYSRRAKALVQVGVTNAAQPHVTRPIGLKLEIVPQRNPYQLARGENFPVTILYEGKPLSGATIKLNNLDFDAEPIEIRTSDARGGATFAVPRSGRWQLNVIWTKAISGNADADFDTTFSSLTFGFDPVLR